MAIGRRSKHKRSGFFNAERSGDIEKTAEVRVKTKGNALNGVLSTLLSFYEPSTGFQFGVSTPARSSLHESLPSSMYSGTLASVSERTSAALMPPPPVPNRAEGTEGHGYPLSMPNISTNSLRPSMHPWTRTFVFRDSRLSTARCVRSFDRECSSHRRRRCSGACDGCTQLQASWLSLISVRASCSGNPRGISLTMAQLLTGK